MTRSYISGCKSAAEGARLAGVEVVAAYPITPQTSIVEELAGAIANGHLAAQMIHVEGEHSAMSACIGASAVGARAFTATSAQGLAMMNEPLFMAAGMRFPIVMALVNRSLVAPNTIFCDHQDSLSTRDTGWLQFYAETCQEVLDSVLIAYRVAEDPRVLLPAMVCLDGFFLSHLYEPVEVPSPEQARAYLPPLQPAYPTLDLEKPRLLNVLVPPEYYTEFEYDKHLGSLNALPVMAEAFAAFEAQFGRRYSAVEAYRTADAEMIIVAMGSMVGTAREAVDRARAAGLPAGLLKIKSFRPFPADEVRKHLAHARVVGTADRNISYGSTGALYQEVARSLYAEGAHRPALLDFVVGLGGRDVSLQTYAHIMEKLDAVRGGASPEPALIWADADRGLLERWGIGL